MNSSSLTRRLALVAGGASLVVMGTLTAGCSTSTKEEPTTKPATSEPATTATATTAPSASSTAPVSPTEKTVVGGNSFTPSINPVPPGAVCKTIVDGVCQR